jgi:hypothetical protein
MLGDPRSFLMDVVEMLCPVWAAHSPQTGSNFKL